MSTVRIKQISESKPSEEVVAKAALTFHVTDARGRRITLKKPSVLSQYRLIEALGETAKNDVYVAMVLPLIYVTAIGDDEHIFVPHNKLQVEALISSLGEEGVNAVMAGVQEHFGGAKTENEQVAAVKK